MAAAIRHVRQRRTRVSAPNFSHGRPRLVGTPAHGPGLPHQRYLGPERRAHGWHITREGWAVIAVLAFWVLVAAIAIARG